jgi:hypothetical protein
MKFKLTKHCTLSSAPAMLTFLFWLESFNASSADDFKRLKGRWQRTDDCYVGMK